MPPTVDACDGNLRAIQPSNFYMIEVEFCINYWVIHETIFWTYYVTGAGHDGQAQRRGIVGHGNEVADVGGDCQARHGQEVGHRVDVFPL